MWQFHFARVRLWVPWTHRSKHCKLSLVKHCRPKLSLEESVLIVIINLRFLQRPQKRSHREPAYSQTLIQNKFDRQRVRSQRESGRQTECPQRMNSVSAIDKTRHTNPPLLSDRLKESNDLSFCDISYQQNKDKFCYMSKSIQLGKEKDGG